MYQETIQQTKPEESDTPNIQPDSSDEARTEIRSIIGELQSKFNADSSLTGEIETILQEYLHRPITSTTTQLIGLALEICIGLDNARRLIELLRKNDPNHIEAIQACATPQMWQWLRHLLAIYGNDLQEAYSVWNENPNGWKGVDRRASFDFVGQRWWLSLTIPKYDGTSLFLEDSPQAMLILASGIVDTLTTIPPDQITKVIVSDALADFQKNADKLIELYDAEPTTEEPANDGEAPAAEDEQMNSSTALP